MLISFPQILLEFAAVGLMIATMAFAAQAVAALLLSDRPLPVAPLRPSIAVLIPAHDEEQTIEATLIGIKEELSPADRLLVVADNCVDRTTTLATRAGADVVIRNDPNLRGKGFALAAGLRHLAATPPDVVVFIDADCRVGSGGVGLLARACAASHAPVQCLNLMIADPDSRAPPPRLAEFAWRIKNDLRPMATHASAYLANCLGPAWRYLGGSLILRCLRQDI
jgi:glycosyltransferase involved in cell wall biosynthesis